MQQQMVRSDDIKEELDEVKAQLSLTERDRNRFFEELREIKKKLIKTSEENHTELSIVKEDLHNANKELKIKEQTILSLQSKVDNVRQLETNLKEKDDAFQKAGQELSLLKSSMSQRDDLLSDCKKKVEELEDEVNRRLESEEKLLGSVLSQRNQLQEASLLLENTRQEAASLRGKMQELEEERNKKDEASRQEIKKLQNEILVKSEKVVHANEEDKSACLETSTFVEEIDVLKNELTRALEAEDNSNKALDDLASALKEVATESNQAKEKLIVTEQELEIVKEEAANLKKMVMSSEGKYEALLKESKKENDRLKNTVNRLRLEAEESLLAWNAKEIEFVKWIKQTEDEKSTVQAKNTKLMESIKGAEGMSDKSKDETKKLRDILKQALNEANVAKEAASLARSENSYLKDTLAEKDKALISLAQETERLRINEAESNEIIKEMKRVITSGSKKEVAKFLEETKEHRKTGKKEPAADNRDKEVKERKLSNTFTFDLNQLWPSIPGMTVKNKDVDDDPEKDDALGGSIFDLIEDPENELPSHHRRTSSACSITDDGCNLILENFIEDAHFDDLEIERSSHVKRKALLRRFGDLLKRKNTHHAPKDVPHPPKEVAHPQKEITA